MTPLRAAIYARYSTELQNARSIQDQFALCENYAHRAGYVVAHRFEDSAKSGASLLGRVGVADLMAAAKAGLFEVVIVESLDRLSRDMADLTQIYKQLQFYGIRIEDVGHGKADDLHVGLRAIVGSIFLKDLAQKVRRGQAGVVRDGRYPGGLPYGYRPIAGKRGELEIFEDEAEVVRRIFNEFLAGSTPRAIVSGLNADRISPPRSSRSWNASTLNGSGARGYGLLRNPLYRGEHLWNRVRMVKNPETGKRVSRVNDPEEWARSPAPHLQIVETHIFDAVQVRLNKRSKTHVSHHRKPKRFLSGLLRCAHCGGGMSIKDHDHGRIRIHCTTSKESGACHSTTAVYLDEVENRVVQGLAGELRTQEATKAFIGAYNAEMKRLTASSRDRLAPIQKELKEIKSTLERTIDLLMRGVIEESDAAPKVAELKARRQNLEQELAAHEAPNVLRLNRHAKTLLAETLDTLADRLGEPIEGQPPEALSKIRELIEKVVVRPVPKSKPKLELYGRLASLITVETETVGGIGGSGGGT